MSKDKPITPVTLLGNPQTAAVASKATRDPRPNGTHLRDRSGTIALNHTGLQQISNSIVQNRQAGENILQLFPDIELAMQIVVGSTLSPKDMKTVEILYGTDDLREIPPGVTAKLVDIVREEIEKNYGLSAEQDRILREAMFEVGSHVKIVLPESSLDDMIHGRDFDSKSLSIVFESAQGGKLDFRRSRGLGALGPMEMTTEASTAALDRLLSRGNQAALDGRLCVKDKNGTYVYDENVEISDNFDTLKMPEITRMVAESQMQSIYHSKRAGAKLTSESATRLARNATGQQANMAMARQRGDTSRKSIGRPLAMDVPPESVMVIHSPGRPADHLAYIMLIDINGNPVSVNSQTPLNGSSYGNVGGIGLGGTNANGSMANYITTRVKESLGGASDAPQSQELIALYGKVIEDNIARRINNGISVGEIEVSEQMEFYRVMWARSMAGKFTRMVFLPRELVTYYAFRYYDNGTGRSYFDNVKLLCTFRAALLYARTLGQVKSAIPITNVNISLDPNDPDPQTTIETAMDEIMRVRSDSIPSGRLSVADMNSWITRQGLEINFEEHPALPNTRLAFETKNLDRQTNDSELDDALRRQTLMAFGLNPDQIDTAQQVEFATSLQQSNLLLSKHTSQLGEKQSAFNTKFARSVLDNDIVIRDRLRKVLKENIGDIKAGMMEHYSSDPNLTGRDLTEDELIDSALDLFIQHLTLSLPKPDANSITVLKDSFDQYMEAVDVAIEFYLGSDMVSAELVGEAANNIEALKQAYRSLMARKWMADNGFLPELADLFGTDENDKLKIDSIELSKTHLKSVVTTLLKFIDSMTKFREAADKDLAELQVEPSDVTSDETTDEPVSDDGVVVDDGVSGLDGAGGMPNLDNIEDTGGGAGTDAAKPEGGADEETTNDLDPDSLG